MLATVNGKLALFPDCEESLSRGFAFARAPVPGTNFRS
jgi:hypothetical protein